MNYQKIYNDLVSRAKTRVLNCYKERHHVIPRCMGGTDDKENLVDLTAREHFIAHWLLTKMHPTVKGLHLAHYAMINTKGIKVSSRTYEVAKYNMSKASSTNAKIQQREGYPWNRYIELYNHWININKPEAKKFALMMKFAGYEDASFHIVKIFKTEGSSPEYIPEQEESTIEINYEKLINDYKNNVSLNFSKARKGLKQSQDTIKRRINSLTSRQKTEKELNRGSKISEAKRNNFKRQNFETLYSYWVEFGKPGAEKFRIKISEHGFPNNSYKRLVKEFKGREALFTFYVY